MELGRIFGPLQILLAVLLVAGMAGLLTLAEIDRSESQAATQALNASDSAIQVAGATARDALTMNQRARAWLVGLASRRDVQISRALLAQRLNTSTRDGDLVGELFEPELGEPLLQFDQAFSSAPRGSGDLAAKYGYTNSRNRRSCIGHHQPPRGARGQY